MKRPKRRQVLECASPLALSYRTRPTQSARGLCSLHASFTRQRGGGSEAKSSGRSAMFIATRAVRSAKLRRSGMYSRSLGHCRRSVGAKIPIHAAPTELGRTSGVVATRNMALLAELDSPPSPTMRERCRALWGFHTEPAQSKAPEDWRTPGRWRGTGMLLTVQGCSQAQPRPTICGRIL